MAQVRKKLEKILVAKPVKDRNKLQAQQEYYQRLKNSGIAKKQTYSLKPLSAI